MERPVHILFFLFLLLKTTKMNDETSSTPCSEDTFSLHSLIHSFTHSFVLREDQKKKEEQDKIEKGKSR